MAKGPRRPPDHLWKTVRLIWARLPKRVTIHHYRSAAATRSLARLREAWRDYDATHG